MASAFTRVKSVLGSHTAAYPLVFVLGVAGGYWIALFTGLIPPLAPLAGALVGLFVAFGVPLWKNFVVDAPKIFFEINSIRRYLIDGLYVPISDDPELSFIEKYLGGRPGSTDEKRREIYVEEIDRLYIDIQNRLTEIPKIIDRVTKDRNQILAIPPPALTSAQARQYNGMLAGVEIPFDQKDPGACHAGLLDIWEKDLELFDAELKDLQTKLPVAKRKLDELRAGFYTRRSKFSVSCLVANYGNLNTAMRAPALLRVDIGHGQYIEIKMKLRDFESKSEIKSNGSSVLYFESSEVSALPADDQDLIRTYWNQAVKAFIISQDVRGGIHKSNPIAFAEGLYEKLIYDRLSRSAGSGL